MGWLWIAAIAYAIPGLYLVRLMSRLGIGPKLEPGDPGYIPRWRRYMLLPIVVVIVVAFWPVVLLVEYIEIRSRK
jgi:hypothetical protein